MSWDDHEGTRRVQSGTTPGAGLPSHMKPERPIIAGVRTTLEITPDGVREIIATYLRDLGHQVEPGQVDLRVGVEVRGIGQAETGERVFKGAWVTVDGGRRG